MITSFAKTIRVAAGLAECRVRRGLSAVACVILLSLSISGQDATGLQPVPSAQAAAAKADYLVGPGDMLDVTVFGVSNFQHSVRVSPSGTIKLPLLGAVPVQGRSCSQVEELLTKLLDEEYIKDPEVSVHVKEYRSQSVLVLGAVRNPGQFQLTHQLSLIDVLALAGGLAPEAGDEVYVQRAAPDSSDGQPTQIKVSFRDFLRDGRAPTGLTIFGGDVIQVPTRIQKFFYVLGEVNSAGAFSLPVDKPIRITQALAQAGGPQKTAKLSQSVLLRYDEKGQRTQLAIDLPDILKGKKDDFLLSPDDIIFVPGSNFKTVTYGLLGMIPQTIARVPYVIR